MKTAVPATADAPAKPKRPKPTGRQNKRPLIVGIGASAGGLGAFKTFFEHMPPDTGMGFVLVQHLDPDHPSILAELLGDHSKMPVAEAEDGMAVTPDHVFVIPPNATLTIVNGRLQVETPAPARANRHPIDSFFASLAADQGENAVCVVLSGAGSDGTLGLKKIKEHGGFALAQEGLVDTAVAGMPASASATGLVDFCVPIAEMPAKLMDYQRHMHQVAERKGPDGNRSDAADHLGTITGLVRAEVGHDFSGYKQNTLVRRIQRRMQVLQIDTVPAYIERLRTEPREVQLLFDDLLIGVTQFFRDPEAWQALEEAVVPKLIEGKTAADELRLWVPGCGTGEEVYSLAILVQEAMDKARVAPTVQIFGTDIDERAIEVARAGSYRKSLPGLSQERRERFFAADEESNVRPVKAIRSMCVFAAHSVTKDPPFSKLDLISCRNLLIYMNNDLQDQVVRKFHYALRPGGFLFLGASEGVARNTRLFATLDKKHRLFQRRDTDAPVVPDIPAMAPEQAMRRREAAEREFAKPTGGEAADRQARRVMEKYAMPYVVVDARREILRFSGGAVGRFLEPSAGAASFELLGMVRKMLRPAVRAAVKESFATGETVMKPNLPLRLDGEARSITLIVEPLDAHGAGKISHCVVAFQDNGPAGAIASAEEAEQRGDVAALEHELRVTKAQLNGAISDLETANEEMRSANEEYQSVNEELQSSNEELETSKEEMQSVNEELQTVNAELTQRTDSLTKANSDLRNLLESTQIATLFLDTEMRIQGFTPGMQEIFHLREGDRGRPVTDIVSRLDYRELKRDAERVLRDLRLVEHEVNLLDGEPQVFIMRIRPYRTVDNVIDGVVITFTDITERKRSEAEQMRLAELVRSSHDAIIGHSLDGIIESWNPAAERIFGYPEAEAIGRPLAMLIPVDRRDEVPELLDRLKRGEPVPKYDVVREGRGGEKIDVELTISPIADASGRMIAASTVARDISARLKHEQHRDLLMHELSHRVKNSLATVQSIMLQTRRNASDLDGFCDAFGKRLAALGQVHNLLIRSQWRDATIGELVRAELEPYCGDGDSRCELSGKPTRVGPNVAVALGMALHELATNATKYGALSTPTGRIEMNWSVANDKGRRVLGLSWTERGGPKVEKPKRRGFGSRLIRQGLKHELDADVTLDFASEGLRCKIRLPLPRRPGSSLGGGG